MFIFPTCEPRALNGPKIQKHEWQYSRLLTMGAYRPVPGFCAGLQPATACRRSAEPDVGQPPTARIAGPGVASPLKLGWEWRVRLSSLASPCSQHPFPITHLPIHSVNVDVHAIINPSSRTFRIAFEIVALGCSSGQSTCRTVHYHDRRPRYVV